MSKHVPPFKRKEAKAPISALSTPASTLTPAIQDIRDLDELVNVFEQKIALERKAEQSAQLSSAASSTSMASVVNENSVSASAQSSNQATDAQAHSEVQASASSSQQSTITITPTSEDDTTSHVLEVYGYASSLNVEFFEKYFGGNLQQFIVLDETRGLAVFKSPQHARKVLEETHHDFQLRQFYANSNLMDSLGQITIPRAERPQTSTGAAHRLISSALNMRIQRTPQQREKDREMREKRKQERESKSQKAESVGDAWD